ncbi:4-(cytidine 5'-diphospho)-2-C-methyl-D-erythritol kinase [bacterium]|nr:4-(cytidine 5'-diphospho)-2-C-methyl-D-erythritol kinase [bacterium]
MEKISVKALAKVNLTLEITDLLPNGYHRLDTVFQALELADILDMEKAASTSLEITDGIGSGFQVGAGADNLVLRAHSLLEQETARELGCRFKLRKFIPAGGGLGGGSADAAAALKGLNELYELRLPYERLHSLAASLGADVAFGLLEGTARGTGRGEILEVLPSPHFLKDLTVILLIPEFGLSTPLVYKAWDALPEAERRPARGSSQKLTEVLTASEDGKQNIIREFCRCLSNDLYPAAESLAPSLSVCHKALAEFGAQKVLLCGSGSTLFALAETQRAEKRRRDLKALAELQRYGKVLFTKFSLK